VQRELVEGGRACTECVRERGQADRSHSDGVRSSRTCRPSKRVVWFCSALLWQPANCGRCAGSSLRNPRAARLPAKLYINRSTSPAASLAAAAGSADIVANIDQQIISLSRSQQASHYGSVLQSMVGGRVCSRSGNFVLSILLS